jgi:PBSX family phage terminase large subunit
MNLHPAQAQVVQSNKRFRVLLAGRRFGKTTLAVWELFGKAVSKKETKCVYLAPNFQQARDIAWQELLRICQPIMVDKNEARLEVKVKAKDGGTSTILLRGWESIESLRGQSFDLVIIDEVASLRHFWTGWQEVLRPALADREGQVLFIGTPKGFNWFYDLYTQSHLSSERARGEWESFHFTTYDNPHIPKTEIEKAKEELPVDKFAQEYLADFRKQEGLVFKEFSRIHHTFEGEKKGEYVGGIDFGFTNPAAVVHVVIDRDNRFWVTGEWYKTGQTEEQIAEYVASCKFNRVYPDPENPSAIKVIQSKRANVIEVNKGKGSIVSGISRIRELLKQNRLYIHKSCVNLLLEMETYAYPDGKEGRNDDEVPVDSNNHAIDALRYVLSSHKADMNDLTARLRQQFLTNEANLSVESNK